MTHTEYRTKLEELRIECATSIKASAVLFHGVDLIDRVQHEVDYYRVRVQQLIAEYQAVQV